MAEQLPNFIPEPPAPPNERKRADAPWDGGRARGQGDEYTPATVTAQRHGESASHTT